MSFVSEVNETNTSEALIKLMYKVSSCGEVIVIEEAFAFACKEHWIDYNSINDTNVLSLSFMMIPNGWRLAGLWQAVKISDQPWWGCDLSRFEDKDNPNTYRMVHGARGAKSPALAVCISALMVCLELNKKVI